MATVEGWDASAAEVEGGEHHSGGTVETWAKALVSQVAVVPKEEGQAVTDS